MTADELLEQAQRDHARMQVANAESACLQAALDAFNTQFQLVWALHCAQMSALIYRGMFDPNFCKPTASGKDCEH